ncbi:IS1182 family transposase [Actinomycetospora lutea]|uniref:IS1182 family transposase n=1 Tax=Actinomycetospora lutea TaxID=663604 RepID=UPI00236674F0|nr:IS1182 family transposase [Actinomycetospora lutea]MDD7938256.1 IS1182 family transposase [Actinomycetospora lutea]
MQGRSDDQRELLDVESVAGHLLKSGSVFAFLATHRTRLFPPELFADLFPTRRGRPSVPPEVVATVLVLQALHGLSDREAVEALTFDLRWKAACGLAIIDTAFDSSTLTYWRRRLAASDRPDRIFETVAAVVSQTGAVAGKTRRALDSTILDDAVARQDTVTQLIAAIRRVAREVPAGAEVVAAVTTSGQDYARPGKPQIAWDDPAARDELVSALVGDALAVLAELETRHPHGRGLDAKQVEAVALLALVAGQDVEPAEGSDGTDGRWRIATKVAPDRVISTVDPDTRHAHKSRERRQDGYRAHVVVEPDTGLITNTALTKAAGPDNSDATVGIALLADDSTLDTLDCAAVVGPVEVLADSAYGTGDALAALDAAGHQAVIKPWPLRPAIPGGFTLDDFTHHATTDTVTCPNGVTRPVTGSGAVIFGVHCRGCPLRERCTTATDGRTLHLGPHHALQRAHRARAGLPEHLESYRRHRPMVERSIAWLTRGNRRVPHRGVVKNNAWLHTRVAAINLRRLLTLGLHLDHDRWALGTI